MTEFTGERVIPGLVDEDLLNEHVARYRFAARFSEGAHVLDAGCGSGYGAAEFGSAASVTATDISADAIRYARQNFAGPGVHFLQASCEALPFAAASFDVVTAFEVIEHLEQWDQLLTEANRVLKPTGVLLVSTPNKSYYAEARGNSGPNPFHSHEFEFSEFKTALHALFPHVRIWTQNHSEAIVFAPQRPSAYTFEADGVVLADTAHFFVAACSQSAIPANEVYAWMPSTANLLRERERHIARLQGELNRKDVWLDELVASHASLQSSHEQTVAELKQRNEWAERLNDEVAERRAAIIQLQAEASVTIAWVRKLEAQTASANAEILRLNRVAADLESDLTARTVWARNLEEQLAERTIHVQIQAQQIAELEQHLRWHAKALSDLNRERLLISKSKWIRLGRKLHVGPLMGEE